MVDQTLAADCLGPSKLQMTKLLWKNIPLTKPFPSVFVLFIFSRTRPTLNLPCISPQNSVTCNGEYRRPVIKAQLSCHDVEVDGGRYQSEIDGGYVEYVNKWCNLFYAQTYRPKHRCGRSTQKDGVGNEHIFRNGSFRELKMAKESNDLSDLAKVSTRIIPEIKWLLSEQKM